MLCTYDKVTIVLEDSDPDLRVDELLVGQLRSVIVSRLTCEDDPQNCSLPLSFSTCGIGQAPTYARPTTISAGSRPLRQQMAWPHRYMYLCRILMEFQHGRVGLCRLCMFYPTASD